MTTWEGCFSVVAYNLSTWLVMVPYCFAHLGIPLAIVLIILVAFQTYFSCELYIQTRAIIPGNYESFYELGYMLMGRKAIFYIGIINFWYNWFAVITCYILFSDITKSLVNSLFYDHREHWTIINNDYFYRMIMGIMMCFFIQKKELKDIKALSVMLVCSVLTFGFILLADSIFRPTKLEGDIWDFSHDHTPTKAFSIILYGFGA